MDLRVSLEDRSLVRRVFVGRHQVHQPAARPALEILHQFMSLLLGPLARRHTDHQPVFGVDGDVIPVVPLQVIRRLIVGAVLLLLADE